MIRCPQCGAEDSDDATRFCGRCGANIQMAPAPSGMSAPPDPVIGRIVDNRYRVIEKIGHGGMGAVYRVEHVAMGKLAAMKLLHPSLTKDEQIGQRFRREALAVSRLSHPNTVQVFDFGDWAGARYLVMELVRGEDLGQVLARDDVLPFQRAAPIFVQVCDALEEAHEAGVIHRDIKPENLLVSRTRDGNDFIKVLDFGLAKLRDQDDISQVTARGALIGTPFYMSPEQIRCEDLDARSDIYSLGAVLYRTLTGSPPFSGSTSVAVLTQHLTEAPQSPRARRPDLNIHPAADALVMRAMAKRPEDRFASAREVRTALEQALQQVTPPPSRPVAARSDSATRRISDDPDAATTALGKRLRREDIDAYERAIKLRRRLLLVLPALAIVAAVALTLVAALKPPDVSDSEKEPNNTPTQANLIASDRTVRGQIGTKLQYGESDHDFYEFHVKHQTQVLHAELTGLPTMDLKLELFDSLGHKVAESNIGENGESEDLPNQRLIPGDYYLEVRVAKEAERATEDFKNWYLLTASWHPLQANEESEPDDVPLLAVSCPLALPMRGMLSSANDIDYYRPEGAGGGTLSGYVSGIDSVDLRIVVLPPGVTSGPPGLVPAGAIVADAGGPGASEHFDGMSWPAGASPPLVVVERKEPKSPLGRHVALVNPDVSYSLTLDLRK